MAAERFNNSYLKDLEKTELRGPLAVLDEDNVSTASSHGISSKSTQYIFPSNLGSELNHWVCFRVSKEHKFRKDTLTKDETRAFIYLPIPQNLSTSYNAQYSTAELGAVGAGFESEGALASAANAGASLAAGSAKEALSLGIGAAVGGAAGKLRGKGKGGALVGGLLGLVAGESLASGATSLIAGTAGMAINPHKAMLFEGTDFRSHRFEYNFVAKNPLESKTLHNIVGVFKYFMSPSASKAVGGNLSAAFFDYPEQFDIDFHYGENLFDIGTSVLRSFGVNYHGQGTPAYFDLDGEKYPVSVQLSMEFQEVSVMTKELIRDRNR